MTTIDQFHQLGLQINKKKSTQRLEFIRADLDSIQAKAILPKHRFTTLTNLISMVTISPQTSLQSGDKELHMLFSTPINTIWKAGAYPFDKTAGLPWY
ncbi:hypothetical protein KIL84_010704 [Mauremys mutica]|uniref:Uncharacterized protein n=1 Tax=Mauremys mutica TaxID=74926 RepID=A0A9D3XCF3_9SAUR|nr:hypothetical protein KIL84_010704 [Mauremys mutica]